jgi:hypothetical protein
MSFLSWLVDKEKRFAWSLLGAIVGLVSLVVAYVATLDKRPQITFAVTNEANVFDVHEPVRNLAVYFQGEDLQRSNRNLRVLTIRIQNTGEVDILQGQYAQDEPWGFAINPGRIVEIRIVASNSGYLARAIQPRLNGSNVQLSKPIFERGKYVVLQALVVHDKTVAPTVQPFGKIAGIERWDVTRSTLRRDDATIWSRLFGGPAWIQALRAITYPFLLIGVGLIIAGTVSLITIAGETLAKRRRARRAAEIRNTNNTRFQTTFLDLYAEKGMAALAQAHTLMMDEKLLARATRRPRFITDRHDPRLTSEAIERSALQQHAHMVASFLLKDGVIERDEHGSVKFADEGKLALDDVMAALDARHSGG